MIFTVEPRYRNCPACGRKVPFSTWDHIPLSSCPRCEQDFLEENTRKINDFFDKLNKRLEEPRDPQKIRYSRFYPICEKFHHIYATPLYSVEELLLVENFRYCGPYGEKKAWVAGYRIADQSQNRHCVLLSWSPLLWDQQKEIFFVGHDEGPRTVEYTPFE